MATTLRRTAAAADRVDRRPRWGLTATAMEVRRISGPARQVQTEAHATGDSAARGGGDGRAARRRARRPRDRPAGAGRLDDRRAHAVLRGRASAGAAPARAARGA